MGQGSRIVLKFTAVFNTEHIHTDSIKIMNRTQGGDTVLFWPDTVLVTNLWVGLPEHYEMNGFQLYQNYPNPAENQTAFDLYIPVQDHVDFMVTDELGRTVLNRSMVLSRGIHTLMFTPGIGITYFLSASWKGYRKSIKVLHAGIWDHQECSLTYIGSKNMQPSRKSLSINRKFTISPGDELLYVGNKMTLKSGMMDIPKESKTYILQFASKMPCPGTPTVEYEGQVYNTVQIFSQCWMKENLNVGTMVPSNQEITDNDVIEKYCYDNVSNNCTKYGGLYPWSEMMQYTTKLGAQGICPVGWHIPTDEEWKVLEGSADSKYGIGDPEWDEIYFRGWDAGKNLRSASGWNSGGNGTDLFGFAGLPGGMLTGSNFERIGTMGWWLTSTDINEYYNVYFRYLYYIRQEVYRAATLLTGGGHSIRCIRDE